MLAFFLIVVKNVLFLRRVALRWLLAAFIAGLRDLRVSHSGAEGDFKLFVQLGVLQVDILVNRVALVLDFLLRRQARLAQVCDVSDEVRAVGRESFWGALVGSNALRKAAPE